jgi:hypothetical protein
MPEAARMSQFDAAEVSLMNVRPESSIMSMIYFFMWDMVRGIFFSLDSIIGIS